MTRKELEQYKSLQKEIADYENKIDKLREKEIEVVSGKVSASMCEHPFTEFRVNVLMEDPKLAYVRDKLIRQYQDKIHEARDLALKIESFIGSIDDSSKRLVFEYRYIDGQGTKDVAKKLNYTKGRISQIVSEYVKD